MILMAQVFIGLYDMSGNVSELCWDWNESYPVSGKTDYYGPTSSSSHVFRGGDCYSYSDSCFSPGQQRACWKKLFHGAAYC